jgi:CheY-like chemotaxis protein/HPt (histidine-containing phosphotransfer) domain-containing protein
MRDTPLTQPHATNTKVLLVEDNRVSRLVAERLLRRWGYAVWTAGDGLEALKLAALNEFDLVLMNQHMPRLDGSATLRLMRRLNPHYSHIPIISLSAAKHQPLDSPFTDFLEKPYMPEQLQNLMQHYLNRAVAPKLRLHLQERLDKLSGGDQLFRQQLVDLFVKNCQELLEDISSGRLDEARFLASVVHKHKSSLRLLELYPLEAALESLQELMAVAGPDAVLLQSRKKVVEQLTQALLEELATETQLV